MVGDSEIDVEAGRNAGCRTVRLVSGKERGDGTADVVASSLLEAIQPIVSAEDRPSENETDRL